MRTLFIMILVGVLGGVDSTTAFADDALTITLNKTAYTPGDAFSAAVTNTSSRTVSYQGLAIEHKQKDGTWKLIRSDTSCPCDAKCRKRVVRLKPGQKKTEKWDYVGRLVKHPCSPVATGAYRAAIYVWDPPMKKWTPAAKPVPFNFKTLSVTLWR